MKIVPEEKYPGMYRLEYDDGTVSDFANFTRINNAMKVEMEYLRRDQYRKGEQKPLEARWCV